MRKLVPGINDLATTHPDLAAEWHPTKNGALTPDMVAPRSDKRVWWLGSCGHEWQASVYSRTARRTGCPYCSGRKVIPGETDLTITHPYLAAEWHPTRNGSLLPKMVSAGRADRVWWLGPCGHEWQAVIYSRTSGRGCPICARKNRAVNHTKTVLEKQGSLEDNCPELALEWHPTKNGDLLPSQVVKGSHKKAWWLCPDCGYEWEARIANRSKGSRCRVCSRRRLAESELDLSEANK